MVYKTQLISTIVDLSLAIVPIIVYKTQLISTIVDIESQQDTRKKSIRLN